MQVPLAPGPNRWPSDIGATQAEEEICGESDRAGEDNGAESRHETDRGGEYQPFGEIVGAFEPLAFGEHSEQEIT